MFNKQDISRNAWFSAILEICPHKLWLQRDRPADYMACRVKCMV